MALLITPDGYTRTATPANGSDFTLDELYALVGCDMVEIVSHPDGRIVVIDEEAKLRGEPKPYNALATAFARECGIADDDWISGTALVCADGEVL